MDYTLSSYKDATSGGVKYKRFEFSNVAAKEMGDELRAVLYADKNGKTYCSEVDIYSAKQYAYNMIGKDDTEIKVKTLLVDMLDY